MKRTPIWALAAAGAFVAAVAAILTWGFYGSFASIHWGLSLTVWIMVAACILCTVKARKSMNDEAIGLDNSQLDPMTMAGFTVFSKASAWTGTLVGGAYLGIAIYVVPNAGFLAAAAEDLPGVLASLAAGIALAVAGVILERNCVTPPPPDGELVG